MSATADTLIRPPSLFDSLRSDRYIVSPSFDWIFFIGSPLLAIAAVFGALEFLPPAAVEGYVLAYMAVGHHVPTMLRAYSDPDEFRANRWRLTAVPMTLLPVMVLLYFYDSRLLTFVFVWDQYHFIRQHYGFMRLYDVKNRSAVERRFNLDQWHCFSLFAAIITHGDFYSYVYTTGLYEMGIALPPWVGPLLRDASMSVAGVISILWLFDIARRVANGQPVALLKIAIHLTTYTVWYYAYTVLAHPLLSYSVSSLFHCLQYDALAWYYNHRKAGTLGSERRYAVFKFVHSTRMVWLYVLAIYSYGFFSQTVGPQLPGLVFLLNRTTGLLHYYYDGFIWRVRRVDVRRHLE